MCEAWFFFTGLALQGESGALHGTSGAIGCAQRGYSEIGRCRDILWVGTAARRLWAWVQQGSFGVQCSIQCSAIVNEILGLRNANFRALRGDSEVGHTFSVWMLRGYSAVGRCRDIPWFGIGLSIVGMLGYSSVGVLCGQAPQGIAA